MIRSVPVIFVTGIFCFDYFTLFLSSIRNEWFWYFQVLSVKVPDEQERSFWWRVFYQGAAFPTLARVLLYGKIIIYTDSKRKKRKKEEQESMFRCPQLENFVLFWWMILERNSRRLALIWAYWVWFLVIGKEESIHRRCMIRGTSRNLDRWFLILDSWSRVCLTHAKYGQDSYS